MSGGIIHPGSKLALRTTPPAITEAAVQRWRRRCCARWPAVSSSMRAVIRLRRIAAAAEPSPAPAITIENCASVPPRISRT